MNITRNTWIVVRNWEKFQHYSDRHPVWIKHYTRLLQDPNYLGLSFASRGLLSTIWLVYAEAGQGYDVASLRAASRQPIYSTQLLSLNHAGFIDLFASKLLALEKEKEIESPYPLVNKSESRSRLEIHASDYAADYDGHDSDEFAEGLDALERKYRGRLSATQREKLFEVALRRERSRRS